MGKRKRKKEKAAEDESTNPYVYIATPAYDGKTHACFSQSLIETAQHATIFGIKITGAVMGNSAFIDLSRNIFARFFLEDNPDCTHLFFIDSDLKFESRAFCGLVQNCNEERPLVAGAYRRRQEPEDYPIVWTPEPEISKEKGENCLWMEEGWVMANRVATGFMCIHRSAIEKMAENVEWIKLHQQRPVPRLFYTYIDDVGRFVGEDFAFCDDYVKTTGNQIWVWPDFDFEHDGYTGNYQKFLSTQVEQHKETKSRRLGRRVA